jgi:hypothetical protein
VPYEMNAEHFSLLDEHVRDLLRDLEAGVPPDLEVMTRNWAQRSNTSSATCSSRKTPRGSTG